MAGWADHASSYLRTVEEIDLAIDKALGSTFYFSEMPSTRRRHGATNCAEELPR
jgi:hypothetical protein